jgi:hypothetical protein
MMIMNAAESVHKYGVSSVYARFRGLHRVNNLLRSRWVDSEWKLSVLARAGLVTIHPQHLRTLFNP